MWYWHGIKNIQGKKMVFKVQYIDIEVDVDTHTQTQEFYVTGDVLYQWR